MRFLYRGSEDDILVNPLHNHDAPLLVCWLKEPIDAVRLLQDGSWLCLVRRIVNVAEYYVEIEIIILIEPIEC